MQSLANLKDGKIVKNKKQFCFFLISTLIKWEYYNFQEVYKSLKGNKELTNYILSKQKNINGTLYVVFCPQITIFMLNHLIFNILFKHSFNIFLNP